MLLGTRFLVADITGADVFVALRGVLKSSCMNPGLSQSTQVDWALWSFMTPLRSAEVGVTFPCSGAHYCFLKRYFGNVISFLNLWTTFLGPGLTARQAPLLAEYSIQPFYPSCSAPKLLKKCLALEVLSSRGVRGVTRLQIDSMMLKMAMHGLLSLSVVVLPVKGRREKLELFQNSFNAEFPEASHCDFVLLCLSGELKKPRKTIRKYLFLAFPLVTLVYFLVNISYLTVLTPKEMLSSGLYDVAICMVSTLIHSSLALLGSCMLEIIKILRIYNNLPAKLDKSKLCSSVHGILQARMLEWVAIPFSWD
ncbi:hypothetical protein FD754_006260, partial [Muntiacus muntjak]